MYLLISLFFSLAQPIWASGNQTAQNMTVALHACVDVPVSQEVTCSITAASSYRLYIDGQFMGYGPSIAAHGYFRVDQYDLTAKLSGGTHVIAIEVAGYNIDNYYIPNQPSFVQAEVVADGKPLVVTHSRALDVPTFQMAISQQRLAFSPKFSFQRPHAESYVLSQDFAQWRMSRTFLLKPTAVERTDAKRLLPRHVKYPDYTIVKPVRMLSNGIYEFPSVRTGFVRATITVTQKARLKLCWDEILVDGDIKEGRLGYHSYIDYELEPGHYTLESFEPYALKYLKMVVSEGFCQITEASVRQYVNSDVSRARFTTDDNALNDIFLAAVETHRQNALDVFMDCPSRERAGWLCDSYFSARVALSLSGNTLIEHNFLENYLLPETFKYIPDGMLPMCYPSDHANGNYIPNWAMWFVLELEEYLARSGDRQMVDDLKPRVLKLAQFFTQYLNSDGLLEDLEKWVFVEWSDANDFVQDVNYPTNMLYAQMLSVIGRLYALPEYTAQAEQIRATIRRQSLRNGFFCDHAVRTNGRLEVQADHQTEVCQYYAFYFDIASPQTDTLLWQTLVNDFGAKRATTGKHPQIRMANAFIGNYLRLELLARAQLTKELLEESRLQFGHMVALTGTLWENTTPATSTCHGFASHIAHVFYRDIAGVQVDYNTHEITLQLAHVAKTGLKRCHIVLPIGDQQLVYEWTYEGGLVGHQVEEVPEGYTYKVVY